MTTHSFKVTMFACVTAALVLLAGFSSAVLAQAPAPAAPEKSKSARYSKDWVEERIVKLHDRLHITSDQESAWSEVAGVMRDNAKSMEVLIDRFAKDAVKMTAIDSLRLHGELAEEHAKGQRKLIPVFEKLYNMMADEQKKITDDVFARQEGRKQQKGK
jgi:periplasmic protein CpxP/Spy